MVQYLHFGILKFPLILCPYDLSSLRPDWPLINALMAANSLARRNILHWGWLIFCGVHLGWWPKEVLLPGTTQYIQDYPHNENIHWPTIINYNIFSFSQFFHIFGFKAFYWAEESPSKSTASLLFPVATSTGGRQPRFCQGKWTVILDGGLDCGVHVGRWNQEGLCPTPLLSHPRRFLMVS